MWGNIYDLMTQIASSSVMFMIIPNGKTFRCHLITFACYDFYSLYARIPVSREY